MLGIFKKKQQLKDSSEIEIKIDGMHCTSCALNIDDTLEDSEGVLSANTSYARSTTKIKFDEKKIDSKKLLQLIKQTGYKGQIVK